jgi:hypothetical protein
MASSVGILWYHAFILPYQVFDIDGHLSFISSISSNPSSPWCILDRWSATTLSAPFLSLILLFQMGTCTWMYFPILWFAGLTSDIYKLATYWHSKLGPLAPQLWHSLFVTLQSFTKIDESFVLASEVRSNSDVEFPELLSSSKAFIILKQHINLKNSRYMGDHFFQRSLAGQRVSYSCFTWSFVHKNKVEHFKNH